MTRNTEDPIKSRNTRNKWRLFWVILAIIVAVAIIALLLWPLNQSSMQHPDEGVDSTVKSDTVAFGNLCKENLNANDSTNFIKISVAYTGTLNDFDVSSFHFNNQNYADDCLEFNNDRDSILAITYAKLDSGVSIVPIRSAVIAKKNRAAYKLSVVVIAPKGDTIGSYSTTREIRFLNDNDRITKSLTLKRYAPKTSASPIAN